MPVVFEVLAHPLCSGLGGGAFYHAKPLGQFGNSGKYLGFPPRIVQVGSDLSGPGTVVEMRTAGGGDFAGIQFTPYKLAFV